MTLPTRAARSTALVLTLSAIAGLMLGPVAGGVATALTAPDPGGPSAPPAVTAPFPGKDNVYVPAVTVDQITKGFLEQAKFTCQPAAPRALTEPAAQQTDCNAPRGVDLVVYIGHDQARVRAVHALCYYPPGTEVCHTLFRRIAELALTGQPELRKRAAAWAVDNADRDVSTVIGGVRLIVTLDSHAIRVFPAD